MDHLDKEVIESLSEPAKRVFKSLDYRSKQRMLKKAREMAKAEKMIRRKKSRFKKKGIEKLNKGKKQKKGSSSKSERVLFSIHETRELMVQSMHLMLLGSSVADDFYEERNADHTEDTPIRLSKETCRRASGRKQAQKWKSSRNTILCTQPSGKRERLQESQRRNRHRLFNREQKQEHRQENLW